MILSNVVRFESVNSIWISDYNTSGRLFDLRCKSLETGIIKRGFERPVHSDMGDYLRLSNDDFRTGEPVAYQIESISTKDLEEWFASDESVPLLDFLARKHSDDAPDTDKTSAEDQDHEQDHQDHEPEPEPDVGQNEPETPQDGLTTLQRQIFTELNEHGAGTVAELIDRLGMPGMQAAIRKNLHILMDEKHLISKRSSIQDGRPAQLWGGDVMAFDATYIPPQMNHWTPEGVMTCVQEAYDEIDFGEKYGAGAIFRMQLDCAVVCLVDILSKGGEDRLANIQQAEEAADDMMKVNGVPFMNESILRQIMADIYDSAEEAVRRWGE